MVKVEFKGVKELDAGLKRMRNQAVPNALRNALNTAAFETRTIWQREIRKDFTLRNKFTEQSIRVEQARGSNMVAIVGSVADYMAVQETGGEVRGKSGGHKVIPRAASAGQKAGAPRTRLVRGRFYLGAIQVAHPALSGGRRQRNAIAIAMARKAGKNIVLLTRPSGSKGLFIMSGGKRALKTRMLWDVSRSMVRVHADPTLERSLTAVKPKLGHMLEAALAQQMQRLGIGK